MLSNKTEFDIGVAWGQMSGQLQAIKEALQIARDENKELWLQIQQQMQETNSRLQLLEQHVHQHQNGEIQGSKWVTIYKKPQVAALGWLTTLGMLVAEIIRRMGS